MEVVENDVGQGEGVMGGGLKSCCAMGGGDRS